MGCTNSKEKRPQQKKKEQVKKEVQAVGNAASPPRPEVPAATADPRASVVRAEHVNAFETYDTTGKYKLAGPSMTGDVHACFKDGLLYRVISDDRWAFYNDTQEYEMHVTVKFGPRSNFIPLGNTTCEKDENDAFVTRLIVYPGDTEPLMEGTYDAYKCNASAKPLSPEYRQRVLEASEKGIEEAVSAMRSVTATSDGQSEALTACERTGVMFVDEEFMPNAESLSRECDVHKIPATPWMRPTEFLPLQLHSQIATFRRGVEPNDIDQGSLGDCWLLCAIASVAEFPDRIEKLFRHPVADKYLESEHKVGGYRVTLNYMGWWTSLVLDDYLPALGGKPVFARNTEDRGEMWVSMLEKAYAKLHGSYSAIAGGDALLALQDLTGFPVNRLDSEWEEALKDESKSDALFQKMFDYDHADYLVSLNTPGVDPIVFNSGGGSAKRSLDERYKKIGLAVGHAYSVLASKYFPEHNLRLLKIRNPWGNGEEWNGPWGDSSEEWEKYPDVASECRHTKAEDGTFWMEWEDAKKYFDGGGVCFAKFNWFDYRVRGQFNGLAPSVVLEINVTKKTEMFIVLSQRDRRGLPSSDPDSKYAAIMVSVSRNTGAKQAVHLNSSTNADAPTDKYTFNFSRDHAMLYTFEPEFSPYLVIPRIYAANPAGHEKKFTLGLLSERKVGDGFTCDFKELEPTCKVFDNYPKFVYESVNCSNVDCEFQHTPATGVPSNRRGTALVHTTI